MIALTDPDLLRTKAYIDGAWVEGRGRFPVVDPANRALLAQVADCDATLVQDAIASAQRAQEEWRERPAGERAGILRAWHDLVLDHADDLAMLLTAEMGKPLKEAKAEILYGAAFLEWFAEEARRAYGDVIPGHQKDRRLIVLKQPVGVVAAITPWNFPNAMIARKVAPALAAGCTIVIKPAHETPLSALALVELGARAGVPAGVLNIVPGTASREIGLEFCRNPAVRKLSFTGSTGVGRTLMEQSAGQIKKLSLELGGNAPFIVFEDADIDAAVEGALLSKFRNAGQTCVCTNRIYVQEQVYDAFVERFALAVSALKVGDGRFADTDVGPLISEKALAQVEAHVADARRKGGSLLCGGARHDLQGCFFQPTVIAGAHSEMQVAREEIFGPVAPVFRFRETAEVLDLANDTEYGLASYFYSRDISRIWQVAERLDFGMVGVNTGAISTEVAPFGGVKQSGLGREGSRYGLDDYLELKYLCLAV